MRYYYQTLNYTFSSLSKGEIKKTSNGTIIYIPIATLHNIANNFRCIAYHVRIYNDKIIATWEEEEKVKIDNIILTSQKKEDIKNYNLTVWGKRKSEY
jgi:hypothetical protein